MNKKERVCDVDNIVEWRHVITILLAVIVVSGRAQTSFDTGDGCLNVIDISYAQGIGEYGDGGLSANYLHEKFINERFSIGAGIGYSQHKNYKFSAIPIYLSTHYFFLDRKFSPFVNLRVGGFALFNAKNVGCNEKILSIKRKAGFQSVHVAKRRCEGAHHSELRHNGFDK